MKAVYILRETRLTKNEEMRYSLRSIQKHAPWIKGIVIVGYKPDWIKGATHIKAEDLYKQKQSNAIHKLLIVLRDRRVTKEFVLFNDDFFFTKDIPTAKDLALNTRVVDLYGMCSYYGKTKYRAATKNTIQLLEAEGLPVNNFEMHEPMIFNKEQLLEVLEKHDHVATPYLHRSLYANTYGLTAPPLLDKKIFVFKDFDRLRREQSDVLSITDQAFRTLWFTNWIKQEFPEPSKWERTT